jgi:hypothetical protein
MYLYGNNISHLLLCSYLFKYSMAFTFFNSFVVSIFPFPRIYSFSNEVEKINCCQLEETESSSYGGDVVKMSHRRHPTEADRLVQKMTMQKGACLFVKCKGEVVKPVIKGSNARNEYDTLVCLAKENVSGTSTTGSNKIHYVQLEEREPFSDEIVIVENGCKIHDNSEADRLIQKMAMQKVP